MKCAFLTMDSLEGYQCYDHLAIKPLANLGWLADEVSWRKEGVNWDQYDLVVIRSPWDYQKDFSKFLEVLKTIENSSAQLANPLHVVNWNINKKYLKELDTKGVEIVPTIWRDTIVAEEINDFFEHFSTEEIIIKPCISAGAYDTFRIKRDNFQSSSTKLVQLFTNRDCMVQPFMPAILSEGEFSIFYFNNEFSHAILKTPTDDDFRVQEEHGGRLSKIEPEAKLKLLAEKVLSAIDSRLLYARLDFVRSATGFALMEAELIEPSLYFNLDPDSPERFAMAIVESMA